MAGVSIGRVWDETWAFLRAENALLLPLSLATTGVAIMMLALAMPAPVAGRLPPGPWMLWLLPAYALTIAGVLAISALALRPGISVGESLKLAAKRVPVAAGVALLLALISLLANIPVVLATLFELQRGGAAGALTGTVNAVMLVAVIWIWVRLLPTWAVVADGRPSPVAVLRDSFALTRGLAGRLLALSAIALGAGIVTGAALLFAGGAVLLTIARAIGDPAIGTLLVSLLLAILVSVATAIWTVLVAFLYRHLQARASG